MIFELSYSDISLDLTIPTEKGNYDYLLYFC